jgi:hypothetical protein
MQHRQPTRHRPSGLAPTAVRPGRQPARPRRRFLLFALALAATPATALAQAADAAIAALERDWAAALVDKDLARLDALLHPSFRLVTVGPSGATITSRPEYLIRQEEAPEWAFTGMTPIAIDVDIRADVAVAGVFMRVGWPADVLAPPDWQFTDVWVATPDGWQVIGRYSQPRTVRNEDL